MDLQIYHNVVLYTLTTATIILSIFLMSCKLSAQAWKDVRIARNISALAFTLLVIPSFFRYLFSIIPETIIFISFFLDTIAYQFLIISAFLMTYGKDNINTKKLAICFSVSTLASIANYFIRACYTNVFLTFSAYLIFVGSCIYQIRLFRQNKIDMNLKFTGIMLYSTILMSFYSAFCLTIPIDIPYIEDIPSVLFTAVCIYYVSSFTTYIYTKKRQDSSITKQKDNKLKFKLDEYVKQLGFLKQDNGMEFVAEELDTDIDFLRYYFRKNMPYDFRTWRLFLRIEYAKKIIEENPSISLNVLSKEAGFNSKSNFYHYFKQFTGKTPSEYKSTMSK